MEDIELEESPSLLLSDGDGSSTHQQRRSKDLSLVLLSRCTLFALLFFTATVVAVVLPLSFLALRATEAAERSAVADRSLSVATGHPAYSSSNVLRIMESSPGTVTVAFGSCSAYDEREQPVFSVLTLPPWNPSAFIWAGDMIYFDMQLHSCEAEPHTVPDCVSCGPGFNAKAFRYGCATLDQRHAIARVRSQLELTDYGQFLSFMCPADYVAGPDCPRPVLGTWDDHDYGWNNGDKTHPLKAEFKQIFLDAVGERLYSPRRSIARGLEYSYFLHADGAESVAVVDQVILLDVRYNRDVLPCTARLDQCLFLQWTDECQLMLGSQIQPFISQLGGAGNRDQLRAKFFQLMQSDQFDGQCCRADDLVQRGWCQRSDSQSHPLWTEACDPFSSQFGRRRLAFHADSGEPVLPTSGGQENYFCDVLGHRQRAWLRRQLNILEVPYHDSSSSSSSSSPENDTSVLRVRSRLLVSGSVVLANPLGGVPCGAAGAAAVPPVYCNCSSDDWDCFPAAQANFIATITHSLKPETDDAPPAAATSHSQPATVVLVGDYHYGDVRVVDPGRSLPQFPDRPLTRPLVQIMSSGLTESTAHSLDCNAVGWAKDKFNARLGGPCNYIDQANFGAVHINQTHMLLTVQPVLAGQRPAIQYAVKL